MTINGVHLQGCESWNFRADPTRQECRTTGCCVAANCDKMTGCKIVGPALPLSARNPNLEPGTLPCLLLKAGPLNCWAPTPMPC